MGALRASVTATLIVAIAGAGASNALSEAKLTLQGGDQPKRDLGEDRAQRTIRLIFDADQPFQTAPLVVLGDAHTAGGRPFDGTVTATVESVAGKTVTVPVVVDPADGAESGTYVVDVNLRGSDIANAKQQLSITLTRSPETWVVVVLAVLALAIGIFLGWALRWLAEKGTKLHDLRDRYDTLAARLSSAYGMPRSLSRDLLEIRLLISNGNVAAAETRLKAVEDNAHLLLGVLDALARTE
jgi:hypothetical protein